jgi:hypothetical protein
MLACIRVQMPQIHIEACLGQEGISGALKLARDGAAPGRSVAGFTKTAHDLEMVVGAEGLEPPASAV